MAQYFYAIAVGSDQTALTNIEDMITDPPMGQIIPLGSVRRITLNQHVQTNGTKIIKWHWDAMSKDDFQELVTFIWGDFDTENESTTIDTRGRDENFFRGNANAILPVEGTDYQRRDHGSVEDLTITFRGFEELGSAFSTAFDFSFEA